MVYAVTDTAVSTSQSNIIAQSKLFLYHSVQVMQFPLADCASHPNCASCLGNGNPLCGWCVVENKCSRMSEYKNSGDSARWIQAARTNTEQCPTITVSPEQYVPENPQTVMQQSRIHNVMYILFNTISILIRFH